MEKQQHTGIDLAWWLSTWSNEQATTRQKILLAAYQEIHLNGYQAASIQNIIDQAGITKGALYHYFKSKHALVDALLDEILSKYVEHVFIAPIEASDDPLNALINTLLSLKEVMTEEDVVLGCPLDSLAQEMTPIDEALQQKIEHLYQRKQIALSDALKRGQLIGTVKTDINPDTAAMMISATLQGCMGMAKSARSLNVLLQCGFGLIDYLEQLKGEQAK